MENIGPRNNVKSTCNLAKWKSTENEKAGYIKIRDWLMANNSPKAKKLGELYNEKVSERVAQWDKWKIWCAFPAMLLWMYARIKHFNVNFQECRGSEDEVHTFITYGAINLCNNMLHNVNLITFNHNIKTPAVQNWIGPSTTAKTAVRIQMGDLSCGTWCRGLWGEGPLFCLSFIHLRWMLHWVKTEGLWRSFVLVMFWLMVAIWSILLYMEYTNSRKFVLRSVYFLKKWNALKARLDVDSILWGIEPGFTALCISTLWMIIWPRWEPCQLDGVSHTGDLPEWPDVHHL